MGNPMLLRSDSALRRDGFPRLSRANERVCKYHLLGERLPIVGTLLHACASNDSGVVRKRPASCPIL
jgi:hypothetical protein